MIRCICHDREEIPSALKLNRSARFRWDRHAAGYQIPFESTVRVLMDIWGSVPAGCCPADLVTLFRMPDRNKNMIPLTKVPLSLLSLTLFSLFRHFWLSRRARHDRLIPIQSHDLLGLPDSLELSGWKSAFTISVVFKMTYINKGSVTGIGVLFPVLALLSLAIRFCAWRVAARRIEIDDILIIPSAVGLGNVCAGRTLLC